MTKIGLHRLAAEYRRGVTTLAYPIYHLFLGRSKASAYLHFLMGYVLQIHDMWGRVKKPEIEREARQTQSQREGQHLEER